LRPAPRAIEDELPPLEDPRTSSRGQATHPDHVAL